jgi:hypothetical protein
MEEPFPYYCPKCFRELKTGVKPGQKSTPRKKVNLTNYAIICGFIIFIIAAIALGIFNMIQK